VSHCPAPAQSSSFTTDVLKLVTGTTFAQAVTILASPLLTRLYGPEAFGFLALFTSITSIIGVIACMPLAISRSYSRRPTKRPQTCWPSASFV
jgi:O-antigen/teichoic acid export membrane protein